MHVEAVGIEGEDGNRPFGADDPDQLAADLIGRGGRELFVLVAK
jgi:hypothetical protein